MSDCHRDYGMAYLPACSGHGTCVNNQCICDAGWTGFTDLEFVDGYDCDISITGVRVWGIVNLIVMAISGVIIFNAIIKDSTYTAAHRFKAKNVCYMSFLGVDITGFIFCLSKAIDPVKFVSGRVMFLTIDGGLLISLTMWGVFGFFLILARFLNIYSKVLPSDIRNRIKRNEKRMARAGPIIATIMSISIFVVLLTASFMPDSTSDYMNIAGAVVMTSSYIYFGSTVLYVLNTFLHEMHSFIEKQKDRLSMELSTPGQVSPVEEAKVIYTKVKLANHLITPFLIGGAPLNILFASWHFLRRKLVFLLMFQMTLVCAMSAALAWSIMVIKREQIRGLDSTRGTDAVGSHPIVITIRKMMYSNGQTPPTGSTRRVSNVQVVPVNDSNTQEHDQLPQPIHFSHHDVEHHVDEHHVDEHLGQ